MPTSTTHPNTSTAFGKRLRAAREKADLRLDDTSVYVRQLLAGDGPSRETIRRFESGGVEEGEVKAIVLAALAQVYGVTLEHLSPLAARKLSKQSELIAQYIPTPPRTPSPRGASRKNSQRRSRSRSTSTGYATAA